ncbi:MAG: hypothetical protein AAGI63_09245, partial [Planctomycetota bacterium]
MRYSLSLSLLAGWLVVAISLNPTVSHAAELFGLKSGTVELKSAGPLAFGPSGVLFVGDVKAAKIYAINTDDKPTDAAPEYSVEDLSGKVAKAYGVTNASIVDLAVNPETKHAFVSVAADGTFGVAKITPDGKVMALNLDKIPTASVNLPNPPEDRAGQGRRRRNPRDSSITDLAFRGGRV